MDKEQLIATLRTELDAAAGDPDNLKGDPETGLWLATPVVRAIGRAHYAEVKALDKEALFDLCETLLETGDGRLRTIAFAWAFRRRRQYAASDFARFERWLRRYVDGWGSCDDVCTHAFGALLYQHPELVPQAQAWTQAENRWLRRAAAVALIYGLRREAHLDAAFEVADLLLTDKDDLVQKGYGWMLKEASKRAPRQVFDYVLAHKNVMPRTALRYAIEKLEPPLRKQAMAR
ncbi:MAG: DNA alkylation repair protein [Anaerolineae bacterium]